MKTTVQEMIDYLSCFPPEAPLYLEAYYYDWECANGVLTFSEHYADFKTQKTLNPYNLCSTMEKLPEPPTRNKSLGYTSENYSD
jgi:hypothetical protein